MALTRAFKDTIANRAAKDKTFRREMLREAIDALLNDDVDVAKSLLRDYINATIQFGPLAQAVHKDSKSLQRMFSKSGNPTLKSLFAVLHELQKNEGVKINVKLH